MKIGAKMATLQDKHRKNPKNGPEKTFFLKNPPEF